MACAVYRGGYRYCFNATPHHCARHQRCGQSPPQGHPNTTLLGFRVALRRRAGLKTLTFGVTWHHVMKTRNMGQRLQDERSLSTVRWHELASGTPGPCVSWNGSCWMKALHDVCIRQVLPQVSEGFKNVTSGATWRHAGTGTGRGQDEANRRGQGEARERPGRGREEARKRPGRGQEEDRRGQGVAGRLPARPADFRRGRRVSARCGNQSISFQRDELQCPLHAKQRKRFRKRSQKNTPWPLGPAMPRRGSPGDTGLARNEKKAQRQVNQTAANEKLCSKDIKGAAKRQPRGSQVPDPDSQNGV